MRNVGFGRSYPTNYRSYYFTLRKSLDNLYRYIRYPYYYLSYATESKPRIRLILAEILTGTRRYPVLRLRLVSF
jgi:hypothetical protein